jgi:proteasome lid subunit RPN8/RPN11
MTLYLPRPVLDAVARHAKSDYPKECCGVLLGEVAGVEGCRVVEAIPTRNRRVDRPADRFAIAPEEILEALKRGRTRGNEIVGYYHSHPDRSGRPSEVDRRDAWSDTFYLILGLKTGRVEEVRSWRLCDSVFREAPVEIVSAFDSAGAPSPEGISNVPGQGP